MKISKKITEAGTDIEEVKRQNANSGLTYNEVKEVLARTGGIGTAQYSDTDPAQVRKANEPADSKA
ncbi:gamma-type small acid-soluble spore protein [Sporosarcina luteola]|uniref:gamma-type small acid-soluble spore protein n=1 Tax=Sporosarcina luteola TaxID=582850 RepID=UPI00203D3B7C|nr:gamma-type small acid-soluble spore protein [Sporosarcina luteola]MCM3744756.1 gamma-type small acid-soluble spore protein [Sporosarcina luteola]